MDLQIAYRSSITPYARYLPSTRVANHWYTSQSIQDKMRGSVEIVSKNQLLEKWLTLVLTSLCSWAQVILQKRFNQLWNI